MFSHFLAKAIGESLSNLPPVPKVCRNNNMLHVHLNSNHTPGQLRQLSGCDLVQSRGESLLTVGSQKVDCRFDKKIEIRHWPAATDSAQRRSTG
jgi:hypothetical protein